MGWETRGNGRYYYRKRRVGDSVVSEYVGRGPFAELEAALDLVEQAEREAERQRWLREITADRELAREIDRVCKMITAVCNATLLLNGYHTHKGQWRKARDK